MRPAVADARGGRSAPRARRGRRRGSSRPGRGRRRRRAGSRGAGPWPATQLSRRAARSRRRPPMQREPQRDGRAGCRRPAPQAVSTSERRQQAGRRRPARSCARSVSSERPMQRQVGPRAGRQPASAATRSDADQASHPGGRTRWRSLGAPPVGASGTRWRCRCAGARPVEPGERGSGRRRCRGRTAARSGIDARRPTSGSGTAGRAVIARPRRARADAGGEQEALGHVEARPAAAAR